MIALLASSTSQLLVSSGWFLVVEEIVHLSESRQSPVKMRDCEFPAFGTLTNFAILKVTFETASGLQNRASFPCEAIRIVDFLRLHSNH